MLSVMNLCGLGKNTGAMQPAAVGSVVTVTTSEAGLFGKTVTLTDGSESMSTSFDSTGAATFYGVNMTGLLTLSASDGENTATAEIVRQEPYLLYYSAILALNSVNIVSWANGSISDISSMLNAAYKGDIDLSDYWNIGDERKVVFPAATVNNTEIGEMELYSLTKCIAISLMSSRRAHAALRLTSSCARTHQRYTVNGM